MVPTHSPGELVKSRASTGRSRGVGPEARLTSEGAAGRAGHGGCADLSPNTGVLREPSSWGRGYPATWCGDCRPCGWVPRSPGPCGALLGPGLVLARGGWRGRMDCSGHPLPSPGRVSVFPVRSGPGCWASEGPGHRPGGVTAPAGRDLSVCPRAVGLLGLSGPNAVLPLNPDPPHPGHPARPREGTPKVSAE